MFHLKPSIQYFIPWEWQIVCACISLFFSCLVNILVEKYFNNATLGIALLMEKEKKKPNHTTKKPSNKQLIFSVEMLCCMGPALMDYWIFRQKRVFSPCKHELIKRSEHCMFSNFEFLNKNSGASFLGNIYK